MSYIENVIITSVLNEKQILRIIVLSNIYAIYILKFGDHFFIKYFRYDLSQSYELLN